MELKWRAEILLSQQESEDLKRAAGDREVSVETLLEQCLQEAIASAARRQKPVEVTDGMACPKCGNMMIETYGKRDRFCRVCGQEFEL